MVEGCFHHSCNHPGLRAGWWQCPAGSVKPPVQLFAFDFRADGILLFRGGGIQLLFQLNDLVILLLHLHGQRQDLGVQRGAGIADALPAGQGGSFGLNGLLGALDGSQHRGHLGQVALGFLQISGHGICIVLGVIFCQNLFAGSKQCIIDRQRHFRQAAGVHFQLVQLALGGVQLGFQPRNLLFQLGDLLVQLVDGIPQLLGQALLWVFSWALPESSWLWALSSSARPSLILASFSSSCFWLRPGGRSP